MDARENSGKGKQLPNMLELGSFVYPFPEQFNDVVSIP